MPGLPGAPAVAAGALLALLLLAAGAAGAASLEATDTRLYDNRFVPFELTVAPGEDIGVRNTGSDRHTFTSVDRAWAELDLAAGAAGTTRGPGEPGDYRFYCRYHASSRAAPGEGMAGVLHVRADAPRGEPAPPSPSPPPPPPPARPAPDGSALLLPAAGLAALLLARSRRRRAVP